VSDSPKTLMSPDGFTVRYTEDEFVYHEWLECEDRDTAMKIADSSGWALREALSNLTGDEDIDFEVKVKQYVTGKEAHIEFTIDPPRPKGHELMGLMIIGSESLFKISKNDPDMAQRIVDMVQSMVKEGEDGQEAVGDS